ncbi:Poly [ADP-ribose] polymerase 1 [Nymphon striatum]|nr:Poly [ADP-ribose] polymerase 1 [Nymphon striatum]
MSGEFPFRAEYAKSGRSSCKGCKSSIAKDSLRLAIMIQSPMFDGKVPNWYHESCFFKKTSVKSISDIGLLDSLRWEDQEKIKSKAGSGSSSKTEESNNLDDFKVEYAKSGKSTCRSCESAIPKGTVRIGITEYEGEKAARFGPYKQWFHCDCFVKERTDLNFYESGDNDSDNSDVDYEPMESDNETIDSYESDDVDLSEHEDDGVMLSDSWKRISDIFSDCRPNSLPKLVRNFSGVNPALNCNANNSVLDCFKKFITNDVIVLQLPGFDSLNDDDQSMVKKKLKVDKKRKAERKVEEKEKVQKVDSKVDVKEQKQLKEQSALMYKHRDLLKQLSKKEMISLLEYNNQGVPSGESALLDALSDIMVFGALVRCHECKDGQFKYSHGTYKCTGNMSEWTKCQVTTREPKREPFKSPADLKENFDFLAKYKFKKRTRTLPKEELIPSAKKSEETDLTKIKKEEAKPLNHVKLAIVGKLKKSKTEVTKKIRELGGEVTSKIDGNVLAVISTESELKKYSRKIQDAEEHEVHVVTEDFLDCVNKGGAAIMVSQCSISTWGSDPNERMSFSYVEKKQLKEDTTYTKSAPSTLKMKIKGGASVEPDSGLEDVAHVYVRKSAIHSVVLGMVDVVRGTNSYYKLQMLESDKKNRYWIYRAWGRLGTTIGGSKIESAGKEVDAAQNFYALYEEKTGNSWKNRDNFQKVPGKFFPMEIDYGQDNEEIQKLDVKESHSKLPKEIQDLVCLIFDVETMKKALVEYEIDLKKMPLGKISKRQIESAYKILTEVLEVIKDGSNANKLLDASNRFYTYIPHDFGMKKPPLLDSEEVIKHKIEMLDSLLEIEIAYNMLKGAMDDKSKDPVDTHYDKLKTDISVLENSCDEFKMIEEYVSNTHADTHSSYDLNVLEAFKINRHGEDKRFKPFKKLNNKKLLWHGSRITNYGGILSQGLRIAPPEAPVTGYMFGKGIYFADMVSKSANYCMTSSSNPTGIMILCEVALGNMYEREHSDYITKLPDGFHSTKGCGSSVPDPDHVMTIGDNVEVPYGKQTTSNSNGSLLYNEYPLSLFLGETPHLISSRELEAEAKLMHEEPRLFRNIGVCGLEWRLMSKIDRKDDKCWKSGLS